jgi:hypothetical protein
MTRYSQVGLFPVKWTYNAQTVEVIPDENVENGLGPFKQTDKPTLYSSPLRLTSQ